MATIREAMPADAAGIARVHVDAWRATYRGIVPDDYLAGLSYEGREPMWAGIFAAGRTDIFVAEDADEEIVGFASGGPERSGDPAGGGELYAVYLLEAYQGRGLGRSLVRAVAGRLAGRGMPSLLVWVAAANPARHFYEALGGTRVRTKEETIGGKVIEEIAYRWTDTRELRCD